MHFKSTLALLVLLSCAGCNPAQEDRAATAASKAVRDTSQTLRDVKETAREGAREAGLVLTDSGLTAKVKTALLVDKEVNGAAIDVDTSGGIVTLTGHLPNQAQVERAIAIARAVEAVKAVESRLSVPASGG